MYDVLPKARVLPALTDRVVNLFKYLRQLLVTDRLRQTVLVGEAFLEGFKLPKKLDRPLALFVNAALPEPNVALAAAEALGH